jgi:hypothetical protein
MSNFAPDVALDALFRRNVAARAEARAIADIDGTALTYSELANAVAEVAEQIAALGLAPRSSIALLLPNGRELVIALLAVLRIGHVAVPMPVAWRKADLVRACRDSEAAALITTTHYNVENLPELAAEVAIEVFELSFPCSFGAPLPDGIVPLSLSADGEHDGTPIRPTAAPGIATLEPANQGVRFVHHRDEELLAAGLCAMLAGNVQGEDKIVSAISLSSFAGLASAFVPWLLSGGTLTLLPDLPGKDALTFDERTHLIATEGALASLCRESEREMASAFAVHFAGTEAHTAFRAPNAKVVVDVIALGEVAAVALPRKERDVVATIPLGKIHAGIAGAASPVILETSIEEGLVHVRGAIVPISIIGEQPWLDTGFAAEMVDASSFHVRPPDTLFAIGALRFDFTDIERRIRAAALVLEIQVLSDPILGAKLSITSDRPAETSRALLDAGLPRIVAASVEKAEAVRVKAS